VQEPPNISELLKPSGMGGSSSSNIKDEDDEEGDGDDGDGDGEKGDTGAMNPERLKAFNVGR